MKALSVIVTPTECYHTAVEREFECPLTFVDRGRCPNLCPYCTGAYKDFAGTVNRTELVGALTSSIFDRGQVAAMKLVSFINDEKNSGKLRRSIWGKKTIKTGQVHGLVLMLFAAEIIEPTFKEGVSAGRNNHRLKDIDVRLVKKTFQRDGSSYEGFALNDPNAWSAFQFNSDNN